MDRRTLLQVLAGAAAATGLPAGTLAALARPGARRTPSLAWFTQRQRNTLTGMVEAIIPATDTPGAAEAGVVDYIEVIVSEWMEAAERSRFMTGLSDAMARGDMASPDADEATAPERWVPVLQALEDEAESLGRGTTSFFRQLKGLTLHGYYTSRVGMMGELLYRPLPGRFEGCVDVTGVTRPSGSGGR